MKEELKEKMLEVVKRLFEDDTYKVLMGGYEREQLLNDIAETLLCSESRQAIDAVFDDYRERE